MVGHLDNPLTLLASTHEVVSYCYRSSEFIQAKKCRDLKELLCWYVVQDNPITDCFDEHLVFIHSLLNGSLGRLFLDINAQYFAEDGLANVQTSLCLLYVIGVWGIVNILSYLSDTRKWM